MGVVDAIAKEPTDRLDRLLFNIKFLLFLL